MPAEPAPLLERRPLTEWELLGTVPGAVAAPGELPADGWRPFTAPTPVAAGLGGVARAGDVDAQDWWFRTLVPGGDGRRTVRFEGVATLADVWVDGLPAGHSEDMYVPLEVDVPAGGGEHEVVVRCAALAPVLA